MTQLESLCIQRNKIDYIPDSISQLINLEELYIWNNNIDSIPDSIQNLTKLIELYIDDNNIGLLPPIPESCNEISMKNNPLRIKNKLRESNDDEYEKSLIIAVDQVISNDMYNRCYAYQQNMLSLVKGPDKK